MSPVFAMAGTATTTRTRSHSLLKVTIALSLVLSGVSAAFPSHQFRPIVVPKGPDHFPTPALSSCHSLASSLFTHAPTVPPAILSFEASWIMTASACQDILPPPTLSAQWSSWTSDVGDWLAAHSADYTSYLAKCEPWALAGGGCPPPAAASQRPTPTATKTVWPVTSNSGSGPSWTNGVGGGGGTTPSVVTPTEGNSGTTATATGSVESQPTADVLGATATARASGTKELLAAWLPLGCSLLFGVVLGAIQRVL